MDNGITDLAEIAEAAYVTKQTASYHLMTLVNQGRVRKISRGKYELQPETDIRICEPFIRKKVDHSIGDRLHEISLNTIEKNLLLEISSKENGNEKWSGREIAKKCSISRNTALKYLKILEEKGLITITIEGRNYVFTPTMVTLEGIFRYFEYSKNGSKWDRTSSKSEPFIEPPTFESFLTWVQRNAHRMIIQFMLLRCDNEILRGSGWIWGRKSCHKHLDIAYIFKTKDPRSHIINVLPKHPFIFTSEIEFQEKMVAFVNDLIERLEKYGIVIDLSQPAEIKMQHVALENDEFARKVVRKGLLYFKSKVKTVGPDGEIIEYAIKIDKSKLVHTEFEGTEAERLTENYTEFIDRVATGEIDYHTIKKLPEITENLKQDIEKIEGVQEIITQNIRDFSVNLESHTGTVRDMKCSSENLKITTISLTTIIKTLEITVKSLKESVEQLTLDKFMEGKNG